MRRLAKEMLIAALGFFALVAQTLLFRDFLTSLEGNEIAVGTFFGSWLIWVGVGAAAGRYLAAKSLAAVARFPIFPILYLPAYLVQHQVIGSARAILGLDSFVVVPLPSLLAFAALVNAPISFLTGFLFAMACVWAADDFQLPVARVYILETAGGFAGGMFVTGLLVLGIAGEKVFLYASLILAAALLTRFIPARMGFWRWGLAAICAIGALLAAGVIGQLASTYAAKAQWSRLLPGDSYRGSFTTAQSRYLYGEREGDFIVMTEGGVILSLPEEEHASEVAAWALAEKPGAVNVLIVGPGGLAIGSRLRVLPQIRDVVWLYPDPEFPAKVEMVLPARIRDDLGQVEAPRQEVRAYLQETGKKFDLVILNLPEATTLVLNRYFTQSFFSLVSDVLTPGGVCAVRVSGGANFLGGERVLVGASTYTTLASVFPHVALKPGDESFLYASDKPVLSELPTELAQRFAAVPGSSQLYPQEGLLAAFPQDRIVFQKSRYNHAETQFGRNLLLNSDDHPKALLFDILLTLRRAGAGSAIGGAVFLCANGTWICLAGIFLFGLLRIIYLKKSSPLHPATELAVNRPAGTFDAQVMLFLAGLAGMSATVVLMFCYQVRFGSLFLDVGLISSLFMLGSAVGGLCCERIVQHGKFTLTRIVLTITCIEAVFFVGLIFFTRLETSRAWLGIFFSLVGVFSGLYFPLAAYWLKTAGYRVEAAAGRLELLDHLGGAAGALFAGLFLLPLLGVEAALIILITSVVVVNLITRISAGNAVPDGNRDWFDRTIRPSGYVLFGLGLFSLLISQGFQATQSGRTEAEFKNAAAEMAAGLDRQERTASLADGQTFSYYTVPGGFLFSSDTLVHGIRGYGGEIPLAIWMDNNGMLKDFRILHSNETPVYLAFLRGWLDKLKGSEMFVTKPFAEIDAVSGATMSSAAILGILARSAGAFGEAVLGRPDQLSNSTSDGTHWQSITLLVWTLVILAVRYRPNRWLRRVMLTVTTVLFGFVLNLQYASQQVMALLSGNFSGELLSAGFFLVVVVPAVVALFGNVYCGHLCPFGALQELLGDLRPRRVLADPGKQVWRYGRFVKYVLLFLFVLLFAMARDFSVLHADPLITLFGAARDRMVTVIALCLLILSFFFRRFWCRNLCPAGAFLSLVGGVRIFRRLLPETRPQACDLGVRSRIELDCLQCDRCRHAKN